MGKSLAAAVTAIIGAIASRGIGKSFMIMVFLGALTTIFYNLVVSVLSEGLTFVVDQLGAVNAPSGLPGSGYQFVGLGGYLADHLQLVECIGVVVSITILKWTLVKIPFLKW